MKKLLALLLAIVMILSLGACSSKDDDDDDDKKSSKKKVSAEQQAADDFVEEYEKLLNDFTDAVEDMDLAKTESLLEDIYDMTSEMVGIYNDLEEVDPDAAEEFQNTIEDMSEEFVEAMEAYTG